MNLFIYLIIFLLPLYLVKFKIGFVPFRVLELMIWLVFAAWLIRGRLREIRGVGEIRGIIMPSFLVLLGVILSTLLSRDIFVSAGILKGWFLAPMAFGLMVYAEAKDGKSIRHLLGALFASASIIAVIAVIYYASGRLTFDGRLSAFYLSPNHLAMYLAPGFLIGLFFIKSSFPPLFQRGGKTAILGGLVFIGAALYLTYSYTAWIAVIMVIGGQWLAVGGRKNKKRFIICGLIFIFLIAVLFLSQIGGEKMNNLLNFERSSWRSRLMIWQAGLEIIKDYPVFGIGPGMFGEYYLKYQSRFSVPYLEWAAPQPHNIFLAFWLQTGILGLIGFLWLLLAFFKRIWSLIKKQDQFAPILLSLMAYTILHGLVDTTYWKNDLATIFWLIIALFLALCHKQTPSADQ